MSNNNRIIGQNIVSAMNTAKLPRSDLAKSISCSYREVCLILEGRIVIIPKRLVKIAEILHTSKSKLIDSSNSTDSPDMILDLINTFVLLKESSD